MIKNESLHDLSVKNDESYIANGIVVHNCRSTWIFIMGDDPYKVTWDTKSDAYLERVGLTRKEYMNGAKGFGKA